MRVHFVALAAVFFFSSCLKKAGNAYKVQGAASKQKYSPLDIGWLLYLPVLDPQDPSDLPETQLEYFPSA
jgi:hypothetical protein